MNLTKKLLPQILFCKDLKLRSNVIFQFILTDSVNCTDLKHYSVAKNILLPFTKCKKKKQIVSLNSYGTHSKKRISKKQSDFSDADYFTVAYSTAEHYDLESISKKLESYTGFVPTSFGQDFSNVTDVVHAVDKSQCNKENQHIFFFRGGSVVLWNISDVKAQTILNFLKAFEENSFDPEIVSNERDSMPYSISTELEKTQIMGDLVVFKDSENLNLERYAISNAISLSVHLGTFEANLEKYIESMHPVTEDLKKGAKIKMSREEVLRKTGQLFALRHNISLNSDLLDTPDFYWDREELESLYQAGFSYFCISKRTRVINEKINHCIELVDLLSSHLNDKHHVRLEWMIIILIMVEVAIEIVHYAERYMESKNVIQHL